MLFIIIMLEDMLYVIRNKPKKLIAEIKYHFEMQPQD